MKQSVGEPRPSQAPEAAYGHRASYHSGLGAWPRTDADYRNYTFVGRMRVTEDEGDDMRSARARAKAKFGPAVNVFRTARWWVVYRYE